MKNETEALRVRADLNSGWEFVRRNPGRRWLCGADGPARAPAVDLPHCWNETDTFQPGVAYYRGPGAYRRRFGLPSASHGEERVWRLESEGFYGTGEVWLNGRRAARIDGQFLGFSLDVTAGLKPGENQVAIRLTNRCPSHILPGIRLPDFLLHGGLAGGVALLGLPPLHLEAGQVRIEYSDLLCPPAWLTITAPIVNSGRGPRRGWIRWALIQPDGGVAAEGRTEEAELQPGQSVATASVLRVAAPRLWSPEAPELYTLRATLCEGDAAVDVAAIPLGLRQAEFRPKEGFFLNGRRLELRGVNRHESMPGFGSALPEPLHREDARAIKDLGLNFVRLSHYPQHPSFLAACDELGLLVYAEIATWKSVRGYGRWLANACRQMRDMVRRDRHHPSVIVWGMGNESQSRRAYRRLRAVAREEDPARPVTYAENHFYRARRAKTAGLPDVWGLNYELDQLEAGRDAAQSGCVIVSECANDPYARRGCAEDELRQVAGIQAALDALADKPYVAGFALWCFNDYATLRKQRYLRHSGVLDAWRLPKLAAALLRARFSEAPFVKLFADWGSARGASPREVHLFTNCAEVSLHRNGCEVAAFAVDKPCRTLSVPFEPGTLRAEARHGSGARVRDELRSHGEAAALDLELEGAAEPVAPGATIAFRVGVKDAEGAAVRDWNGRAQVRVEGGARLRGFDPAGTVSICGGLGRGFLTVPATAAGTVRLEAAAEGLAAASAAFRLAPAAGARAPWSGGGQP